jgi:hypothetical protein
LKDGLSRLVNKRLLKSQQSVAVARGLPLGGKFAWKINADGVMRQD